MQLNLLLQTVGNEDLVIRQSAQVFGGPTKGMWTDTVANEMIADDGLRQVQVQEALPNDWRPRWYKWTGTAFLPSTEYQSSPEIEPEPQTLGKINGVTYDEFRKLFTVPELILLENFDQDDYFAALRLTPLNVEQKAMIRYLIGEAKATGAPGAAGINLGSPKLSQALDQLGAWTVLGAQRPSQIKAGVIKS